jgi:hypothetical protein
MLTEQPSPGTKKSYIVHMTLKDNEDGEVFVIENEFLSENWISAWHHVMRLPNRFSATLVSHRLREVDKATGKLTDQPRVPIIATPPSREPLALPAPRKSAPPEAPKWYTQVYVAFPDPSGLNV